MSNTSCPSQSWLWNQYYDAVRNRPPRDTLLKALDLFESDRTPILHGDAIDLGCGSGVDTFALLERGWSVLAVDYNAEGIRQLTEAAPPALHDRLTALCIPFEQADLPEANLVNASYSLPFCPPSHFPALWANIVKAIRTGGRFAGQLFGPNDTWAAAGKVTFHTKDAALASFTDFDIEYLHERDEEGTTALGDTKHWHVLSIVARKRL